MSYTSQDRLPMIPRRKSPGTRGVIRITPSFLDRVEKAYAVIVVCLFAGAFVKMLLGDLGESDASKTSWYLTTGILYTLAGMFLFFAVFYRRMPIRLPLALALLLALAGVSALWSNDPGRLVIKWPSLLGTYLIGIYFAVRFQPRELLRIMWQALTIMTVASFISIFLLPQMGITVGVVTADGRSMPVGVFGHKNTLGSMMLLSVITYTFTHFEGAAVRRRNRLVNLALLVMAAFLLVWSESTTAQLLGGLGAVVFIYVAFARRAGLVSSPLMLLALWFAALLGWAIVVDTGTFAGLVGKDATLTGRTEIWSVAIRVIEQRPLWGYGYGTDVLKNFITWRHSHNGFIATALQFGLVGSLLMLVFLVQTGWRCYAVTKASSEALAMWPLVIFVALVTRNLAEESFMGSNSLTWVLLIYLASSNALTHWPRPEGFEESMSSMGAQNKRRRVTG